jgi:hypothetical protein
MDDFGFCHNDVRIFQVCSTPNRQDFSKQMLPDTSILTLQAHSNWSMIQGGNQQYACRNPVRVQLALPGEPLPNPKCPDRTG